MKFKIDKKDFLRVLQRIQGIVEKRNSMPILSNILIDVKSDRVYVISTDLEIFIKDSSAAEVEKEGSITVNARKFYEIIKELPDENVTVSLGDADKVSVKGGRAKFKIPGLDAKEFPAFPATDENKLTEIETDNLKEMIDKTLFATSTDETRYNINGVLFESDGKNMKMVATDGHRLALIEGKGEEIGGHEKGVILPRKGITEIRKLLEDKNDPLLIGFTAKNITVKKGTVVMNLRLIEGEFPDYNQVIPKDSDKELIVDKATLLASLKRVSILSAEKIKGVKFAISKGKLVLSSSTPENGDATEEVDIDYKGEGLEIAFNARYFMDVLEILDVEKIKFCVKEQLNPGVLKIPDNDSFTYVIMPMRL
ncbi:MAG: DNA polymerase III subunit beta [Thermodesulfobacteriota bacterium]